MNTETIIHPSLHCLGLTTGNLEVMIDWYQKVRSMSVVHQTDAAVARRCLARRRHSHHVACPGWQPTIRARRRFSHSWQLSGRASERPGLPPALIEPSGRRPWRGLASHTDSLKSISCSGFQPQRDIW